MKEIFSIVISLIPILLLFYSLMSYSYALGANSINIFNPENNPYGLPYEQHVKDFWKWIISIPQDKNPWADESGETCDYWAIRNKFIHFLSKW